MKVAVRTSGGALRSAVRALCRVIEAATAVAGLMLLLRALFAMVSAYRYQREEGLALDQELQPDVSLPSAPSAQIVPAPIQIGDPVGRLQIPRLGLSVVVANGDDDG